MTAKLKLPAEWSPKLRAAAARCGPTRSRRARREHREPSPRPRSIENGRGAAEFGPKASGRPFQRPPTHADRYMSELAAGADESKDAAPEAPAAGEGAPGPKHPTQYT